MSRQELLMNAVDVYANLLGQRAMMVYCDEAQVRTPRASS